MGPLMLASFDRDGERGTGEKSPPFTALMRPSHRGLSSVFFLFSTCVASWPATSSAAPRALSAHVISHGRMPTRRGEALQILPTATQRLRSSVDGSGRTAAS